MNMFNETRNGQLQVLPFLANMLVRVIGTGKYPQYFLQYVNAVFIKFETKIKKLEYKIIITIHLLSNQIQFFFLNITKYLKMRSKGKN